jgi:hypothetical protein
MVSLDKTPLYQGIAERLDNCRNVKLTVDDIRKFDEEGGFLVIWAPQGKKLAEGPNEFRIVKTRREVGKLINGKYSDTADMMSSDNLFIRFAKSDN